MTSPEASRFVRLRVELVLEIKDSDELRQAAYERIDGDAAMSDEERAHARSTAGTDEAEALAHLIDPFDLVDEVSGIELAQASWTSEWVDFDPDVPGWRDDFGDDMDED
jgi:hypothetical protein